MASLEKMYGTFPRQHGSKFRICNTTDSDKNKLVPSRNIIYSRTSIAGSATFVKVNVELKK